MVGVEGIIQVKATLHMQSANVITVLGYRTIENPDRLPGTLKSSRNCPHICAAINMPFDIVRILLSSEASEPVRTSSWGGIAMIVALRPITTTLSLSIASVAVFLWVVVSAYSACEFCTQACNGSV